MSEEPQTPGGNGHGALAPEVALREAEFRAAAADVLLARTLFMRQAGITFGGARDTYAILGYDRQITVKQFRDRYARGGVAGRIVDAFPNACWRGTMELVEDEDPEKETPFEKAWADLDQRLQIQAKLLRVDKLSRLSTYAVLLIGAPGPLNEELPRGTPEQLLYLTPFLGGGGPGGDSNARTLAADADCTIALYNVDTKSPRFGLPETYQLKRTDISSPELQVPIHWSRIIHVAENVLENEVYGQPALERVWNLLDDLDKVTGGGAEAFWLRANQGLHLDIDKDMKLDDTKDTIAKLKEQTDAYKHQIDRWIRTKGTTVSTLGSDVANFSNPADAILTQLAGATTMPKRILTGSEMGELASSQDRDNWKDQINGRQTSHCGPYIVRNLVNRLIAYGYMPTPTGGALVYEVVWPHIQTLTDQEKAEGAAKWASVNSTAGMTVFTDAEIRDHWYGLAPGDMTKEDKDTEPWRAELALKLATANKTQGAVVFTDDEIRKTCYGWAPLKPEEKVPITAPERVSATAPTPAADAQGKPIAAAPAKPALVAAEDAVLLRAAGDVPGHEFHGNQYTHGSAAGAHEAAARAHESAAKAQGDATRKSTRDAFGSVSLAGERADEATLQASKATNEALTHSTRVSGADISEHSDAYAISELTDKALQHAFDARNANDRQDAVQSHRDAAQAHRGAARIHRELTPRHLEAADIELLRVLEAAIVAGNEVVIHHIIGLQEYKFGSTQVQLPPAVAERLYALGRTIPDADIYEPEGGRETDAHVTVKYGLLEPDVMLLSQVIVNRGASTPTLNKYGAITLTLGKTAMFSTPDYDVVFVTVDSQDLAALNRAISNGVPCAPTSHGEYQPHATVAYVKPGTGQKYVGLDALAGTEVTAETLVLSKTDGSREEVSLA